MPPTITKPENGVLFPADPKSGKRSTLSGGKAVFSAAAKAVDEKLSNKIASEKDFRGGYEKHVVALMEAGSASPGRQPPISASTPGCQLKPRLVTGSSNLPTYAEPVWRRSGASVSSVGAKRSRRARGELAGADRNHIYHGSLRAWFYLTKKSRNSLVGGSFFNSFFWCSENQMSFEVISASGLA